ncbi:hypothetical protein THRCLA_10109 [Thraustotheca clavata]|uniref:RING-type domain-containing protein n=1 Tax=Thraustotheca clavata TaxID=74557 RepID=A0A1V9YSS6_9STRA|nr:hypothetical protein THRCLA_10109 [Thraustotheca clavata]
MVCLYHLWNSSAIKMPNMSLINKFNALEETFGVESACYVNCPQCDEMQSTLPPMRMKMPKFCLLQLRAFCALYCHYLCSGKEFYHYIKDTFSNDAVKILSSILPQIHDGERRVALFLRWKREDCFIKTNCCGAILCFLCKSSGHNAGYSCESINSNGEIAQCPYCKLQLYKADGCDSVMYYCGYKFSWDEARIAFQFQFIPPKALKKLKLLVRWRIFPRQDKLFRSNLNISGAFSSAFALSDLILGLDNGQFVSSASPSFTYHAISKVYFTFDYKNALRLISFQLTPIQRNSGDVAASRVYFSRIFGGESKNEDIILINGASSPQLNNDMEISM